MGIVASQTIKNTLVTYFGFVIGAINTLFLYTNFLTPTYYGVVGYLLSASTIMMPILAFGTQNTLIKYFSFYKDQSQKNAFTGLVFLLPVLIAIPAAIIGCIGYGWIVDIVASKNHILVPYVWTIFVLAFFMAYFELFYAWAKVHLKSVYGNLLKEVYHRVMIMVLLLGVSLELYPVETFIYLLMAVYGSRLVLMAIAAIWIKKPTIAWFLPNNYKEVLHYSLLIILTGSIAVVLLDIDKVMLGQFMSIDNIAYYNVAVFMAVVIAVPARAMHQITYPITSKFINSNNMNELAVLYKKSSINLYLVAGGIFLLVTLNVNALYELLPPNYEQGVMVVFLIGIAKVFDNLMGNNNAIIFNSDYYQIVLFFGLLLAGLTVCLNIIFIPVWGLNGAAFATLLSFIIYNSTKLIFVYRKLGIHPFTKATLNTTMVLVVIFVLFFWWDFDFHPLISILLKSILIGLLFALGIYLLNLSEDITAMIHGFKRKYLKK